MGGLIYAWGGGGGGGFLWDLGLELKLKLAWEQAHLCQLGVGKPPAYLTHSSWRLGAASSATKTSPNAGYFKISLKKLLFFFFTGNIFGVNSSLSFTVTIAAPNLLFVRLT